MEQDLVNIMESGKDSQKDYSSNNQLLQQLRSKISYYMKWHQLETALYWADKVNSLSGGQKEDVFQYAQCLLLCGHYQRAVHQLKLTELDKKSLVGQYISACCWFESREWQESLDVLDQLHNHSNVEETLQLLPQLSITREKLQSCINLLRGKVYEAMDNQNLAAECFRESLRLDMFCYEAFNRLVGHHLLTVQQEEDLLDSLPFDTQCTENETKLIRFLYGSQLKKYCKPSKMQLPTEWMELTNNMDVMVMMAERHYYNCNYQESYAITKRVMSQDPYHSACLPIHISLLVELHQSSELFYLAHKLVDLYPTAAVAWFAVGCYYYTIGKQEPARRYLSKATSLDHHYGFAWLAYGHSFAVENEHDQAMAAYFSASHIMKGCHLPLLYIGLEHGLTNNLQLADRFFSQALAIAPEDPFVLHEMGVVAFHNHDYENAEQCMKKALEKVDSIGETMVTDSWEALLNNLGHVTRKLGKYDEALDFHQRAIVLSPSKGSTYAAIAFCYALKLEFEKAIEFFHKALSLQRSDTFSTTMLSCTLEKMVDNLSTTMFDDEPTYQLNKTKVVLEQSLQNTSAVDISLNASNMIIETEMDCL